MTQRRRARCARRNGGNYGKLRKEAGRLTGLLASSDASRTGIVQRETGGAFDVPPRFAVARLAVARLAVARFAVARFAVAQFAAAQFAAAQLAVA
jgi:hypothetical protein